MRQKIAGTIFVGSAIAVALYGPGERNPRLLGVTVGETERLVMVVALALLGLVVLALSGRRVGAKLRAAIDGVDASSDTRFSDLSQRRRMSDGGYGPIVFGLLVCAGFFGALVLWSALARVESAAVAQATVRVEINRQTVDHPDGGTIAELLVREGEHVKSGQVLLRLDTTELYAELKVATRRQQALKALQARLTAEQQDAPTITYPDDLLASSQTDPEIASLIATQDTHFRASAEAFGKDIAVRERSIKAFEERITGLEAQLNSTREQVEIINLELVDLEALFAKKLTPQSRVLALRRERARLQGAAGSLIAEIAQARTRIGQTELSIVQQRQDRLATTSEKIRETFTEEMSLLPRISAVRTKLSRTVLRAPTDGDVFGLTKFTVGGVVRPGEPVLEIVPVGSELVVEARIDPVHRDVLKVGMPARVRFTAFNIRDTQPVDGEIARISADAVTDEASNTKYYTGVVRVLSERLIERGLVLEPGMPAEVIVPLTARTPLQYLLEPLLRNWERALQEE